MTVEIERVEYKDGSEEYFLRVGGNYLTFFGSPVPWSTRFLSRAIKKRNSLNPVVKKEIVK